MTFFEFDWLSQDQLALKGRCWLPEGRAKAVCCMVHGFTEHIGRYEEMARAFNAAGYIFVGYDLRGHGRSEGERGYTPTYEHIMEDTASLLELVSHKFPQLPLILSGHSMGGNIVVNLALRYPETARRIRALIMLSPWLRLTNEPGAVVVAMTRAAHRVYPRFGLKALNLRPDYLSRDPEVIRSVMRDPMMHLRMTASLFLSMREAGQYALEHADQLSVPTLLMHGTDDQVTDYKASEAFAIAAPHTVTSKIWPGMRHELHQELERTDVLRYLISWTDEQLVAIEQGE